MATELEKAKEIENTSPEQAMELLSSIGKPKRKGFQLMFTVL